MQKTAIVVPCYNEFHRLKVNEFLSFTKKNRGVSFFFVNDGSTDDTDKLINHLSREAPEQIQCINLKKNCGKAQAVRLGFLKAIGMDFQNIGYWDADLSTPLDVINKFCELLNDDRTTIVMGARVRLLGHRINRRALRHYLGRVFATSASIVLGLHVYDTQCGAKIFKNTHFLKKVFSQPFTVKWIFDVEILARFKVIQKIESGNLFKNSALEYPIKEWTHSSGSKVRIIDFFVAILDLLKIYIYLKISSKKSDYGDQFKD
jgi:glycosyltransferase involved in cell wall biosynthesis